MAVYGLNSSSTEYDNKSIDSSSIKNDSVFEDIEYVSIRNKVIDEQLNINDEIPFETCNVYNANITEQFFKDALLLSLYNQVDYLRKELDEKNEIIKSLLSRNTVSTNEVDFLRNELNEKNFLLRTITIKDSHVYVQREAR